MVNIKERIRSVLIYFQRFTKTDNIYLAKNGIWAYAYYATAIGLGIVVSVVFARFSNPATYGYYQYIMAITATVAFLSMPGINTAILRSVTTGKEQSLIVGLKVRLKYSLLSVLALGGLAAYYFFIGKNEILARLVLLGAVFFPTTYAFNCLFTLFNGRKQFFKFYAWEFIMNLVSTASVVFAVLVLKDILWILAFNFASYAVFYLVLYYFIVKRENLNSEQDEEIIPYGKKLTYIGLIPQILGNFDQLVIPHFLGVDSLAIYAISVKIPSALKNLMVSINPIIFPRLVDLKISAVLKKMANFWMIFSFLILLLITIASLPFAIHLLFGPNYLQAVRLAQIASLSIFPVFLTKVVTDWSLANKQSKFYLNITAISDLGNAVFVIGALLIFHTLVSMVIAKVVVNVLALLVALILALKSRSSTGPLEEKTIS